MRGETVIVRRRVQNGVDEGNNPTYETVDESVDDVLIAPASTANAGDSTRPEGVNIDLTACFPRAYDGPSLRGAAVVVRGITYAVEGDPIRVDGGLTPTRWNLAVDLHRTEG